MTTDTEGGVCLACRASPTRICAEHHVGSPIHTTDEEIANDRLLAEKDARIRELERDLATMRSSRVITNESGCLQEDSASADGDTGNSLPQVDHQSVYEVIASLRAALEAEKARSATYREEREASRDAYQRAVELQTALAAERDAEKARAERAEARPAEAVAERGVLRARGGGK